MALQHLRSGVANKRPIPTIMSEGQIALNTNEASPGLFFKDSNGDLVKIGPVHIGTSAPNSSPASTAATALVTGATYQILTVGTSDFTLVGASANTVGTIFTATGTTTGTGTVSGQQGVEKGEQWLDTTGGTYVLKIYDGTDWRSESGTFVDVSGDTMTGDLVMNNANIVFEGATADDFETTLTVTDPTADRTITLPNVTGTVVTTGDTGSVTSTMIADGTIVNADINASAEIAVSKLANGTARQLLQTDAAGTGVEFTSNVDVPGTLDVTGAGTFDSTLTATGLISANGKVSFPAGTAAAPSLYPGSDTDTGIYSPGSDQLAISTNGTGRLFVDASGNVGVGLSSPQTRFHSSGTTNGAQATFGVSNSGLKISTFQKTDNDAGVILDAQQASNGTLTFATTGQERLRITSDGKVGVGTSSPAELLHVEGNNGAGVSQNILCKNTATNSSYASLFVVAGTSSVQLFSDAAGNAIGTPGAMLRTNSAIPLVFGTNNTERMRIDSSGRVGIGTTSPGYKLSVNGDAHISTGLGINTTPSAGRTLEIDSFSSAGIRIINSSAASGAYLNFWDSKTGGANQNYLGCEGNNLVYKPNNVEKARIDSSGRLLVGTSSESGNAKHVVRGNTGSSTGSGVLDIGLGTTRPGSAGTPLGYIRFTSTSNTSGNYHYAAISAESDGTSSSDTDIPGRLVFSTTADGASSPTPRVTINSGGTLYPNADNSYYLGVGSNRWAAVYAANGTIQTSDQRTKTEVLNASLGSDFIKALRPVSYKWIEGGKRETLERDENGEAVFESVPGKRTHWGFVAQEVKQAVDDAGVDFGGWVLTDKDDPDSQQALRYDQFVAPLTKALQEALAEIDVLKAKVAALEGN